MNPFWNYLSEEQRHHARLVRWLKMDARTKDLLWWHTPNEGAKTAFERFLVGIMGNKKGVSDFIFAEPRGPYVGLIIELKAPGVQVYKKRGGGVLAKHKKQMDFIIAMRARGWKADFINGDEKAKKYVLDYLKLK